MSKFDEKAFREWGSNGASHEIFTYIREWLGDQYPGNCADQVISELQDRLRLAQDTLLEIDQQRVTAEEAVYEKSWRYQDLFEKINKQNKTLSKRLIKLKKKVKGKGKKKVKGKGKKR